MAVDDVDALAFDDLASVAKLEAGEKYQSVMAVRSACGTAAGGGAWGGGPWGGPPSPAYPPYPPTSHRQRVRHALDHGCDAGPALGPAAGPPLAAGPSAPAAPDAPVGVEADPTYRLLVDCNALAVEIDNEIAGVHAFARDKYRPKVRDRGGGRGEGGGVGGGWGWCGLAGEALRGKVGGARRRHPRRTLPPSTAPKPPAPTEPSQFPELESLVHHPLDYARVVTRLGNAEDAAGVELDDVLPQATIMVVCVTASTTAGAALPPDQLDAVLQACAMIQRLDEDKVWGWRRGL